MAASSGDSRTKTFEKDGQRFFIDRVDFQGALFKQSSWLKEWRRRWFMLVGSRLFFAKDRHSDPHGFIDLRNAMTVKSLTGPKVNHRPHAFEIRVAPARGGTNSGGGGGIASFFNDIAGDSTFLFYADSDGIKDAWIGRVGRAIVRASSQFHGRRGSGNGGRGGGGEDDDDDDDDDGDESDDSETAYV